MDTVTQRSKNIHTPYYLNIYLQYPIISIMRTVW